MLALAAALPKSGTIGFDGCLIAVVARKQLRPVIALAANTGTGLPKTLFAAGNRVLDVLRTRAAHCAEATGGEDITFATLPAAV